MADFRVGNRGFSRAEVETFIRGSENPYFEPLRGKEDELRAWLASEGTGETQKTTGVDDGDAYLDLEPSAAGDSSIDIGGSI